MATLAEPVPLGSGPHTLPAIPSLEPWFPSEETLYLRRGLVEAINQHGTACIADLAEQFAALLATGWNDRHEHELILLWSTRWRFTTLEGAPYWIGDMARKTLASWRIGLPETQAELRSLGILGTKRPDTRGSLALPSECTRQIPPRAPSMELVVPLDGAESTEDYEPDPLVESEEEYLERCRLRYRQYKKAGFKPTATKAARHFDWAARRLVGGESFCEIAKSESVTTPSVIEAVDSLCCQLGLPHPTRSPAGRKKGVREETPGHVVR